MKIYFIGGGNMAVSILNGLKKLNEPLHNFLLNKWYFDELYEFLFIKPLKVIGFILFKSISASINIKKDKLNSMYFFK